MAFKKNVQKA